MTVKMTELLTEVGRAKNRKENSVSGIYGIYIDNALVYIGSSNNCAKRFTQHKCKVFKREEDRNDWQKDNTLIYKSLRLAYANGDNITFKVLDLEQNVEKLRLLERQYIKFYKPLCNVKPY